MEDVGFDGDKFDSNFRILLESVQHHVEQEKAKMFLKVRQVLDAASCERLGKNLVKGKHRRKTD
jgi:hypothetical protein